MNVPIEANSNIRLVASDDIPISCFYTDEQSRNEIFSKQNKYFSPPINLIIQSVVTMKLRE